MGEAVLAQKDRTIFWSVIVSIIIHGVVLIPAIRNMVPEDIFKLEERMIEAPPIEFELVSPPEQPTPTNRQSQYLSTVSSAASDDSPDNDDSALPQREGVIPLPDTPSDQAGAEGGGDTELPPLPKRLRIWGKRSNARSS